MTPRTLGPRRRRRCISEGNSYDPRKGTLKRRYRNGQIAVDGFLDDYAFLIQGLLDLYETSFDVQWLLWAVRLQDKQDETFWDATHSTYYATATSDPSVLFRMRDEYDGAEPSANSVAAMNLSRLSQLTDNAERKAKADKTFSRVFKSPETVTRRIASTYGSEDFGHSNRSRSSFRKGQCRRYACDDPGDSRALYSQQAPDSCRWRSRASSDCAMASGC